MGRLDRSNIFNAGARDPSKPRIVHYKGQRRRQVYPAGKWERFVNLQGSIVPIVLVPPGTPVTAEGIAKERSRLHRKHTVDGEIQGYMEHGECPMLNGNWRLTDTLKAEFSKMPSELQTPCKHDPVTFKRDRKGNVEYFDSCPHIEWLIQSRREVNKAKVAARMKRQKTMQEIEQLKLDAVQQQADDTRKLLEKVVDRIDRPQRKAPTE